MNPKWTEVEWDGKCQVYADGHYALAPNEFDDWGIDLMWVNPCEFLPHKEGPIDLTRCVIDMLDEFWASGPNDDWSYSSAEMESDVRKALEEIEARVNQSLPHLWYQDESKRIIFRANESNA